MNRKTKQKNLSTSSATSILDFQPVCSISYVFDSIAPLIPQLIKWHFTVTSIQRCKILCTLHPYFILRKTPLSFYFIRVSVASGK